VANSSPTGVAPVLQVHPLHRCNLACAHCYTASGPTAREELPLELLSACLEDAVHLGYRQLAVSGGEPLLYKPLARLVAHARSLGMISTLTTNGMLATPATWAGLAPFVDVVAISIDGTPREHDTIRRREGAFARTLANLETIRSSGVPFGFIFTLTQHNVDSLEFVVRLAADFGARGVQVHPLTLQGRAATDMCHARPDDLELAAALAEADELGRVHGIPVQVDSVTRAQLFAHHDHFVPARPVERLADVAPTLIVNADGAVVPLTQDVAPRLGLGTLTKASLTSLADAWIARGSGDSLAEACDDTWQALTSSSGPHVLYWFDAVAARTLEAFGRDRELTMLPVVRHPQVA
jgi:Fe-coproporphyrin III synthase